MERENIQIKRLPLLSVGEGSGQEQSDLHSALALLPPFLYSPTLAGASLSFDVVFFLWPPMATTPTQDINLFTISVFHLCYTNQRTEMLV